MSAPSLHSKVLAYADLLARSSGELPAVDVAWRLRVIAGVLCSYGDGCQSSPWDGYTACERHVSQLALEDSWAPTGVASPSAASITSPDLSSRPEGDEW